MTQSSWAILPLVGILVLPTGAAAKKKRDVTPSHSTTIALFARDQNLLVVNRDTDSLSVLNVRRRGNDVGAKIAEVAVGREPHCVAVGRKEKEAFVTNAVSGTVSIVALAGKRANSVVAEIPVGTEPRACAITPNKKLLFVANYTAGTVSVVDTSVRRVVDTVAVGPNPAAIAVTNDGDKDDADETVFVTRFFAEPVPGGPGEGFDTGKRGVVWFFPSASPRTVGTLTLSPIVNSGFTADRTAFCPAVAPAPPASDVFCPDVTVTDPNSNAIKADPQGAFPNQLGSILIRGGRVYVPNIGAAPEPPIKFNVNVQALVHVVDATARQEAASLHVNLNEQIKSETQPAPADATKTLTRVFGNDVVAIDATRSGSAFFVVSRGGNYVMRAALDANQKLTLNAPNVIRFRTGNIPNGIVVSADGRRAYVNNEVNLSVSVLNLETNDVLTRDLPSAEPPVPGTFAHAVLVGKLAFFTALGVPDNGIFSMAVREIVPLENRGKASDNGWSGCASCHPDGLADGVTWIFATGPRQTIPLDAFFSKDNPGDQRISNYSAVMGSITDFNNNAKGVQGGTGFAGNPANPNIHQHGLTQGASDALDAMTLWVQTVRTPLAPPGVAARVASGRDVFGTQCAACHGGAKWSKSQVVYRDNPAFTKDPAAGGVPTDPGVNLGVVGAGPQIVSYTLGTNTIRFLEPVGTFNPANKLEIRATGAAPLGALGFNVPSLLGIGQSAPYFHDGSAQTLAAVFAAHDLGGGKIATALTTTQRDDLQAFLNSIDGRTVPFPSATDAFLDAVDVN